MDLHYIDGSPFARIIRVLNRELGLGIEEREITEFPPPPDFHRLNPMGQVPVLIEADEAWFPTRIVIDVLLGKAPGGNSTVAMGTNRPDHRLADEQTLAVILAMGDALALHHYLDWSGSAPSQRNRLGFDVAERSMVRVLSTLDWLETRLDADGFWPGTISIQDIALACFIFWSESRGPIDWRGRPKMEALIDRLEPRPSFVQTAPRPHVLK